MSWTPLLSGTQSWFPVTFAQVLEWLVPYMLIVLAVVAFFLVLIKVVIPRVKQWEDGVRARQTAAFDKKKKNK